LRRFCFPEVSRFEKAADPRDRIRLTRPAYRKRRDPCSEWSRVWINGEIINPRALWREKRIFDIIITRDHEDQREKKMKKTKKYNIDIAGWAMEPFENFEKEINRVMHTVRLSSKGVVLFLGVRLLEPKLVDKQLKRKEIKFAKQESKMGFPTLYAWAVIGLWAHLETLIRNFLATWLKHKKSAWKIEAIDRLRIKLGEYETVPKDQKYLYVAGLLENDLGAGQKAGVNRFEVLLEPFSLSGKTPRFVTDTIYEFSQVRNLFAHNAGIVDRHFIKSCPWIKTSLGSYFHVSAEMFTRYVAASIAYACVLICRIGTLDGVDIANVQKDITNLEKIYERSKKAKNTTADAMREYLYRINKAANKHKKSH